MKNEGKLLPFGFNDLFPEDAPAVWIDKVGNGFQRGARQVGVTGGAAFGTGSFGSRSARDFIWSTAHSGQIFTDLIGSEDNWYRGNWSFFSELSAGIQFHPDSSKSIVGFTPGFRYYFATGRAVVPFFDVGGGVAITDIREPELGSAFQFNLQGGTGVQWFLTEGWAATLQFRYFHLSNAKISLPNSGLDQFSGMIGVTRFY
ncbi:MAG: acyloxyacyl hydrolase [Opitutales bacterium]